MVFTNSSIKHACRQPGSLTWGLSFGLRVLSKKTKAADIIQVKKSCWRLVRGSCSLFVKERKRPQLLLHHSNDIKKRPARTGAETILNPNLGRVKFD